MDNVQIGDTTFLLDFVSKIYTLITLKFTKLDNFQLIMKHFFDMDGRC